MMASTWLDDLQGRLTALAIFIFVSDTTRVNERVLIITI